MVNNLFIMLYNLFTMVYNLFIRDKHKKKIQKKKTTQINKIKKDIKYNYFGKMRKRYFWPFWLFLFEIIILS